MALIFGDADHLLGEPILGKPQVNQIYVYDGQAFVPAAVGDLESVREMAVSIGEALEKAGQAMDKSRQTQEFLDQIVDENRINIPALEKNALLCAIQNVQLQSLRWAMTNEQAEGELVNGFFSVFRGTLSVDMDVSNALYLDDKGIFTSHDLSSALNRSLKIDDPSLMERVNFQGEAVYWRQDDSETGHLEGAEQVFVDASVNNRGDGKVGFPALNNGLIPGQMVRFYGFNNSAYNSAHVLDSSSTASEIVVSAIFVAEEITPDCKYRKILSVGSSGDCPGIETGMQMELESSERRIVWIDETTQGRGIGKMALDLPAPSQPINGISGIEIGIEGIEITSGHDFLGSRNKSTLDAVPGLTGSENVSFSSQTTNFEAYKVFDDHHGTDFRWLSAANNTSGWVCYDFGETARVINKYRWRTFENASSSVPGAWRLEASNDNHNWTVLHEGSNSVQTANTWIPQNAEGYFSFYNSRAYRYYRFYVTANCGHPQYLCIDEIELIEAPAKVFPLSIMALISKPQLIPDIAQWHSIESMDISENKPGLSKIFYAVTFDGGQSWSVFKDSSWQEITRIVSGQWYFRNAGNSWELVEENTQFKAIQRAFGVPTNQMTAQEFEQLGPDDWSLPGTWISTTKSFQFAAGLQSDGLDNPLIENISISYSTKSSGLILVSMPKPIRHNSQNVCASLLLKNQHDSLKLYVFTSEEDGWVEMGQLIEAANFGNEIGFFVTSEIHVRANSNVRLKVECESSHGLELYGWALNGW